MRQRVGPPRPPIPDFHAARRGHCGGDDLYLSEDVRLSLDDKADALEKRVHDLSAESKCRAYTGSYTLPESDRGNAVLQAWDDYREQQLGPLVKEAASLFARVLEHSPGPYEERKAWVRRYVIASVIEPAMKLTRSWFWWACKGKVLRIDSEPLAHWAAPLWLDSGRPILTDQESTLRLRLSQILEWAVKGCVLQRFEKPSAIPASPAVVASRRKPAKTSRYERHARCLATFWRTHPAPTHEDICREFDKKSLPAPPTCGPRLWVECLRSKKRGTATSAVKRIKERALLLQSAACSKIV